MKCVTNFIGVIFFTSLYLPVSGYSLSKDQSTGEKSSPETSGSSSASASTTTSSSTSTTTATASTSTTDSTMSEAKATDSKTFSAWLLHFQTASALGKDRVVYVGQGQCGCKTSEYTYLESNSSDTYPSIYCYEKEGEKDSRVLYETLSSSFDSLGTQADDCFSDYQSSLAYNFAGTCGCPTGLSASIGLDGQVTCTANDGITMLKRYDGMEVHTGFLDDGGTCDSANASCKFAENCDTPSALLATADISVLESISYCFALGQESTVPSFFQSEDRTVKLSLDMNACRDAIYGKVILPTDAVFLTADDIVINSDGCTIDGNPVNSSGKSCSFLKNLIASYNSNSQASTTSVTSTTAQSVSLKAGSISSTISKKSSSSSQTTATSGGSTVTATGGTKLKGSSTSRTMASPASSKP